MRTTSIRVTTSSASTVCSAITTALSRPGTSKCVRTNQIVGTHGAVLDAPGCELARLQVEDHVGPAFPQPDVLDVGPRRPWRAREVGVEDGELVALVLEEPHVGIGAELEAIRTFGRVRAGHVPLREAVTQHDQAAGLVGSLRLGVLDERRTHLGGDHHQMRSSMAGPTSPSAFVQKSADRYFQPPSARIVTTTASSSSSAIRRATCTTAPDETPAKIPSRSSRIRSASTDSSFETRILRSSFETSRIG